VYPRSAMIGNRTIAIHTSWVVGIREPPSRAAATSLMRRMAQHSGRARRDGTVSAVTGLCDQHHNTAALLTSGLLSSNTHQLLLPEVRPWVEHAAPAQAGADQDAWDEVVPGEPVDGPSTWAMGF